MSLRVDNKQQKYCLICFWQLYVHTVWMTHPPSPQEIHGSKSESSPFPLFQFETFTFLTQLKFETTIFSPLSAEKKVVLIANYKVSLLQESSHQWINPFMHRDDYFKMSFLILAKKVPWKDIYGMNWKAWFQVPPKGGSTKLRWQATLVPSFGCFHIMLQGLLLQSLLSAIYVNNRFFQLCYSLFTLRKNGSDMVWPKIDHISHQIGVVISGVP